jgi:threonine/homoserine/homoserine lactone efflux protein
MAVRICRARPSLGPVISGDRLVGFLLTVGVLILVPGPSVLFAVGRALALGRIPALATVAGNAMGVFAQGVLFAVGLGALVERSVLAFEVVKFAGALYLVWLGLSAIRHRRDLADVLSRTPQARSAWRSAREGFVVGISNPKVVVIFTAVLPPFVDRSAGHVTGQLLVLSLIAMGIALVSDSLWVLLAGTAREWLARKPRRAESLGGIGGAMMIAVGLKVAATPSH